MGFPEGEKISNGAEAVLKAVLRVTMAKTFLELIADLNPKNQEAPGSAEQNQTKHLSCRGRGRINKTQTIL